MLSKLAEAFGSLRKFPKAAPFIIGNEVAERFSFYGMKAILTTFLIQQFMYSEAAANERTHLFITQAYIFSIVGAFLADWFLGKYRTILWLSIVYCVGHLCLAIFDINPSGFLFGLFLIALGAGGIKPCVSANVGDQFDESNKHLISKLYDVFYFSINVGASFSMIITPWLRAKYGASVAFAVPGVLMAIATLIFWMGRDKYKMLKPTGWPKAFFLEILFYPVFTFFSRKPGASYWGGAIEKYGRQRVENTQAVLKAITVFLFIPVFWALYDQNGSEWVIQATKMDTHVLGMQLLPEQVQSINGYLILLFIPLFSLVVYPMVEAMGVRVTPLRKIGTGFFLVAVSFIIIAYIQQSIDAGGRPSIGWQLLAYAVLTAAEIMVSITGLEYAYMQAPPTMKSTVMACFLSTVAIGNYLVTLINRNIEAGGYFSRYKNADGGFVAGYFWFFTGLMLVTWLVYVLVAWRMKEGKVYVHAAGDAQEGVHN